MTNTTRRTLLGAILMILVLLIANVFCVSDASAQSRRAGKKKAAAEVEEAAEEAEETTEEAEEAPAKKGAKTGKSKKAAAEPVVNAEDAAGEELDEDLGVKGEDEEVIEEPDENAPLPKPTVITGKALQTKDGVLLSMQYYASNKGKRAVPIILIHSWEGSRKDFSVLAPYLQENGFAVFVPDMRGHGESTKREIAKEQYEEIELKRFDSSAFNAMLMQDLQAIKRFIRLENNRGMLNVNKLCVVGIGEGALLASTFASTDWSIKKRKKNSLEGDIQAVTMISTPKNAKKLKFADTLLPISGWNANFSYLFLSGKDNDKKIENVKTMETTIRKKLAKRNKDLMENVFAVELKAELQGPKLIADGESESLKLILEFFDRRSKSRDIPWEKRD